MRLFKRHPYILICIYILLWFLGLSILCLLFNAGSSDKTSNLIELIILILYSLVGGFVILKRIILIVKDENKSNKKIEHFVRFIENFNYESATNEEKRDYLIYYLFVSSNNESLYYFYISCANFNKTEIKELLYNLLDDEFNKFIEQTILKLKDNANIFIYQTRLFNILLERCKMEKEDLTKYYFDYTRQIRLSIRQNKNKYNVLIERYKNEKWIFEKVIKNFLTEDDAYLTISKIIRNINQAFENIDKSNKEIDISDLKRNAYFFKLKKEKFKMDEFVLFDYYTNVSNTGHERFYTYLKKKKLFKKYVQRLKILLPIEYKPVLDFFISKDFKKADQTFITLKDKLTPILDKFIVDFKLNILN